MIYEVPNLLNPHIETIENVVRLTNDIWTDARGALTRREAAARARRIVAMRAYEAAQDAFDAAAAALEAPSKRSRKAVR